MNQITQFFLEAESVTLNEDTNLWKAFHKEIHLEHINKNTGVRYIRNIIDSNDLNNIFLDLIKTTNGDISKTNYKSKHKYFQNTSNRY